MTEPKNNFTEFIKDCDYQGHSANFYINDNPSKQS